MALKRTGAEKKAMTFDGIGFDEVDGVIEGIFAVTGNRDEYGDRLLPGAFSKTIAERKAKIPMDIDHEDGFGLTLDMQEIGREDLPRSIREASAEAKGGVWARGQVLLSDQNAAKLAALRRKMASGVPPRMSFQYHAITEMKGQEGGRVVRDLAEVALTAWGPLLNRKPVNSLAHVTEAKAMLVGSHEELRQDLRVAIGALPQFSGADWFGIEGTFADHVIAFAETKAGERSYWHVGFGRVDGALQLGEVTEVDLATVVVEKKAQPTTLQLFVNHCSAEMKAGRVLSQKNLNALQAAIEQLERILKAAQGTEETAAAATAEGKSRAPEQTEGSTEDTAADEAPSNETEDYDIDAAFLTLEMGMDALGRELAAIGR